VLTIILVFTVPMDLVVFSYVKFRDAASGTESEKWIPALVALWTIMLWSMPVIVIWVWRMWLPDLWTIILMSARAAITAVQLSYVALYIRIGRGATPLK